VQGNLVGIKGRLRQDKNYAQPQRARERDTVMISSYGASQRRGNQYQGQSSSSRAELRLTGRVLALASPFQIWNISLPAVHLLCKDKILVRVGFTFKYLFILILFSLIVCRVKWHSIHRDEQHGMKRKSLCLELVLLPLP
jgi:hypothetical protein